MAAAGEALRLTRAGVDIAASVVRLESGVTENREGRRVSERAPKRDGHKSGRIRRLREVKWDSAQVVQDVYQCEVSVFLTR